MHALTGLSGLSGLTRADAPIQSQTRSAGAGAATGTGAVWASPGSIVSSNDARATCALTGFQTSQHLRATNFGFTATGTILGVVVSAERSQAAMTGQTQFSHAQLMHGGAVVGDEKTPATPFTTIDTIEAMGDSTDLWGTSLTAAQVNSGTFGVELDVEEVGGGNETARVDHVQITVYFQ